MPVPSNSRTFRVFLQPVRRTLGAAIEFLIEFTKYTPKLTVGEATMRKVPDFSGYSLRDLDRLVAAASKRMQELRGKRIKELQTELDRLGVGQGVAHRARKARQRDVSSASSRSRQEPPAPAGRKVTPQFRGPNGEEYSGRGAIPRWARDLGVKERADLEQFRIS